MLRIIFFTFFALLSCSMTVAQQSVIDSLTKAVDEALTDSLKWFYSQELSAAYYRADLDSAQKYALFGHEVAEKSQKPQWLATSTNTLGTVNWYRGNIEKALEYYFTSVEIAENNNLPTSQSTTLSNIGIIYVERNEPEKAIRYLEEALKIKESLNDSMGMARTLTNIGLNYFHLKEFEPALTTFKRALAIAESLGATFGEALLLSNIGSVYMEMDKTKLARKYYEKSLPLRIQLKDNGGLSVIKSNIAKTYINEENYEKAIPLLEESYDIAKKLGSFNVLNEPLDGLVIAHQNQGNFKKAFEFQQELMAVKDSINNQRVIESTADMEAKYQAQKKEALLAEKQLQINKEKTSRYTIIYLASIAILLLGILTLLTRNRARNRKKQAELEKAESEKLRELDKVKSTFFANISHEFRTPLTLIKGPLESMLDGSFKDNREKYYRIMLRNCNRLLNLVNQLLDLSKLESGRMELQVEKGNIGKFLNAITHSFDSLAATKQIDFDIRVEPALNEGYFDKDKLEKICSNLLSNAFKFTGEEGKISFKAGLSETKDQMYIQVTDNGVGIPEDQLPHIFDRFYSKSLAGDDLDSSGIGLALVRELVRMQEGTIKVKSAQDKGTRFDIMLPLGPQLLEKGIEIPATQVKTSPIRSTSKREAISSPSIEPALSSGEIILIVEDNEDVRHYVADQLKEKYMVLEAENGKTGLDIAIQQVPNLIISDVMMPEMDGIELCNQLRKHSATSHIPIVLLTAKAGQEDKLEGLETGADEYLTKPFNAQELQLRVKNLMLQQRRLRERFSKEITFKPQEVAVTSVDESFLNEIVRVIEENMEEELFGVSELARAIGLSRSQLHRKLKALSDKSPSQIIRDMRLKRAKELLEKGAGNASEVAFMVGFNSLAYFSKCFKDNYGIPPSEVNKREVS